MSASNDQLISYAIEVRSISSLGSAHELCVGEEEIHIAPTTGHLETDREDKDHIAAVYRLQGERAKKWLGEFHIAKGVYL